MRTLAYRDEGGLGAIDEATERARAEELLRVGRGRESEREDAQHGEEHRRQKDEVTLRLAVPTLVPRRRWRSEGGPTAGAAYVPT